MKKLKFLTTTLLLLFLQYSYLYAQLDNDNDGISNVTECGDLTSYSATRFLVATWTYNGNPQSYDPNVGVHNGDFDSWSVASVGAAFGGPGVTTALGYFPLSSVQISNVNQTTLAGAMSDGDYMQFQFTTNSLLSLGRPRELYVDAFYQWIVAGSNIYDFAVGFATTSAFSDEQIILQSTTPNPASSGFSYYPVLANGVVYELLPNTTYYFRVYVYNAPASQQVVLDDVSIRGYMLPGGDKFCDTDGDGIKNNVDIDSDNDGIPDEDEGNGDTDGDGVPDYLDLDSDNDGILDVDEGGNGDLDTNGDGVIDSGDAGYADANSDGQADGSLDANEEPDTDGDGIPDYQDLDSDNDGINDVYEGGNVALDANKDGIIDGTDDDGDGILDPVDGDITVFGEGPGGDADHLDSDGDGTPNSQDLDNDNDGTYDTVEGGNTALDADKDGLIDGTTDVDSDGILDPVDGDVSVFGEGLNGDKSLPVDLLSFKTRPADKHTAMLSWTTASEINNSHFDIERSYDGKSFEAVGDVAGNGNSQHQIDYSYTDASVSKVENTVYYRLKQVDFDGEYEYSAIRVVRFDAEGNDMQLVAYPNPINNELNVKVGLYNGESYQLEVTNLQGVLVHQNSYVFSSGLHTLDLSQWNSGVYIVEVISDRGSEHIKVMKN